MARRYRIINYRRVVRELERIVGIRDKKITKSKGRGNKRDEHYTP